MTKKTEYIFYGLSDKGLKRENNEDRFWINETGNFLAVADGLGGHQAGAMASEKAIELMQSIFAEDIFIDSGKNKQSVETLLKNGLKSINERIHLMGTKNPEYEGLGCTAAIGFVHENTVHACHVGDSRTYIINRDYIRQLGKDHRIRPYSSGLTMALGMPKPVVPEYNTIGLKTNDRILLCSDGLSDMLSDAEIQKIVVSSDNAKTICEKLINDANKAGGNDNITVVIFVNKSND